MQITVAELIVKYLKHLGIQHVFGIPGAHILPVYDALYDADIDTVLVKHEQGAAFMAGGYARVSGRIAACITTAGPGATNLVTGIASAYVDQQPILIITGETSTHIFGKGGLQESSGEGGTIDQVELFHSITRYNKIVERTDYLPQVLNTASKILLSDNPGPVVLSFPFNVQSELVDDDLLLKVKAKRHAQTIDEHNPAIIALKERLLAAQHPVIIAGFGCINAGAQSQVQALSELLSIPVATSLKAKGVIDEDDELSLGSLGVSSNGMAYRYIAEQADLLLFLGASFNERTSYLWDDSLLANKQILQIDRHVGQLEKVFQADLAIQGDLAEVLDALLAHVDADSRHANGTKAAISTLKNTANASYAIFQSGYSMVELFFEALAKHYPQDLMVFDDNIIFAQNFFAVSKSNNYYPNSGISSLGHAIPAAIGARFALQRPAWAILGDGGFQMCCMEIMTAVNYGIPLNILLFNNSTMGLIRKNQHQSYEQRFIACDFINPDYAKLAESFGIVHQVLRQPEDLERLFIDVDLTAGINLIEIPIDKNSFPNYSSRRR